MGFWGSTYQLYYLSCLHMLNSCLFLFVLVNIPWTKIKFYFHKNTQTKIKMETTPIWFCATFPTSRSPPGQWLCSNIGYEQLLISVLPELKPVIQPALRRNQKRADRTVGRLSKDPERSQPWLCLLRIEGIGEKRMPVTRFPLFPMCSTNISSLSKSL